MISSFLTLSVLPTGMKNCWQYSGEGGAAASALPMPLSFHSNNLNRCQMWSVDCLYALVKGPLELMMFTRDHSSLRPAPYQTSLERAQFAGREAAQREGFGCFAGLACSHRQQCLGTTFGSERGGCSETCHKLYIKIMEAPGTRMRFLAHSTVQATSH